MSRKRPTGSAAASAPAGAPLDPAREGPARQAVARARGQWDAGDLHGARATLDAAFRADTRSVEVMSWYGAVLAVGESELLRGVALCEAAVRKAGPAADGDLYWNLARALLAARYRASAAEALRRGVALDPEHAGLHQTLVEMGIRRRPVFPFLRRSHPLNKYLGKARHALFPPPEA